ncbi:M15 family metallopeptidase [Luteipulveratus mongoliensis]|uniref:M15 family metallopeptidase n=1 Tax=Luteipulveratus mongoliensis TaxID=571913 RepID=UPI001C54F254|nr:M15 family metallopeptidase [Luteipulveratus mongoliensis]
MRKGTNRTTRLAMLATPAVVGAMILGGCSDLTGGGDSDNQAFSSPLPAATPSASSTPTPTLGLQSSGETSTSSTTRRPSTTRTPSTSSSTSTKAVRKDKSGTKGLNPDLANALIKARQAAAPAGVRLHVTSGYRPASVQEKLFQEAVRKYGSEKEARRWVLPPKDSSHVQRRAIDVGPRAGARWLELHGAKFGLCRTYRNEWWHFEHVGKGGSCPPMYRDAAQAAGY